MIGVDFARRVRVAFRLQFMRPADILFPFLRRDEDQRAFRSAASALVTVRGAENRLHPVLVLRQVEEFQHLKQAL